MIPTIDRVRTGKRLKYLMDKQGITVKDIQNYLSLSCVQTVYRWLEGVNVPAIDHLYALSGLFHVAMDDIVVGNRPPLFPNGNALFPERMVLYFQFFSQCAAA